MLIFSSLVLAACGSSAPANLYLLHMQAAPMVTGSEKKVDDVISIGIGPVEIPEYLDRPQIVVRTGANTIKIHEFDRWAEPIKDGITRVITENLVALIETEKIIIHPWSSPLRVDYRLGLHFTRFEASSDGEAILAGWWSLYDTEKRNISKRQPFLLTQKTKNLKLETMVDGQSDLLAKLCEGMATYLNGEPASPGKPPGE